MATISDRKDLNRLRNKTLLSGLKLELMGMKKRGASCYSIIKSEHNLKGNKQKVYDQFEAIINGDK